MIKRIFLCFILTMLLTMSLFSCDQAPCAKGHSETVLAEVLPTCTQVGKTAGTYCSVCGETLIASQDIPPLGHTEVIEAAVASTCTESGRTEGKRCVVCSEILIASQETPPLGHTEQTDAAVVPTCTAAGRTEGKKCAICNEILLAHQPIEPLGHRVVSLPAVQPTCTEKGLTAGEQCSVCHEFLTAQIGVSALGHVAVSDPSVEATCIRTGLTEGSHCGVCALTLTSQTVIEAKGHIWLNEDQTPVTCYGGKIGAGTYCAVCGYIERDQTTIQRPAHSFENNRCTVCGVAQDFSDVSLYAGTWFYDYCATLEKGAEYQELYRRLDEAVTVFHTSSAEVLSVTNQGFGIAVTVRYDDLGLDVDDLRLIRMFYHYDHPLYYWLSGTFRYRQGNFSLFVFNEYIDSNVRKEINQKIYAKIAEIAESVAGVDSTYELTLAYHDAIIECMDYARQENGKAVEAEDARWAYNIVGPFVLGSGVCRGYADAFSLLLNYSGITNVITRGVADVAHRWNQVLMEDGQWYWFDLTWDDAPETEQGVAYHYFCVSDAQEVGWKDQTVNGSYSLGNGTTFSYKHTSDFDYGATNYVFDMDYPDCADVPYEDSKHLNLRDTFTVDDITYALIGYRKLQVIGIHESGTIAIPRTITYQGILYTVTAIGYMDTESRLMMQCTPISGVIDEVIIPDTVDYIGIHALNKVKNILLHPQNTAFYIKNGALYDILSHRRLAKTTQADTLIYD